MKVEASIDEADIGLVKAGQRAFFTVDSFPDKQFRGRRRSEASPRTLAMVNQNVVTYKVVMEITNESRNADAPRAEEAGRMGARGKDGAPDFGMPCGNG